MMGTARPCASSAFEISGTAAAAALGATLRRVAWLSIVLGLTIEAILLLLATGFGGIPGISKIVAELVQKISWSMIVCVGLAFGKTASRGQPAWTGLSGLLSAPIAFSVAGTLHKSASYALKLAGAGPTGAFPFLVTGLKGLEYGALGWLLTWVGRRTQVGAASYAGVGFGVGLVFGLAIVYSSGAQTLAMPTVLYQCVNEVLFPIGCSLALFAADALGKSKAQGNA